MRLSPVLLLLFLSLPVAEIYLLIQVGGWIGAGWTLLLLLASDLLLLRLLPRCQDGLSYLRWRRIRNSLRRCLRLWRRILSQLRRQG